MTFPRYDEDGSEEIGFQNLWRNIDPQEITGVDCFQPDMKLKPIDNLVTLRLTDVEFTQMFSALYNGAESTYPDTFMQVIANFLKGLHCPPEVQEDECTEFPTYANFIDYAPMNPFVDPETIPEGYVIPPFVVLTDENLAEYAGYELDDVIAPINSFPLDTGWFEDLSGAMPTITIEVIGEGKVGVKLLTQPNGGLVIVTVDNPPNLVDILASVITGADNIVDVNKDVLSLPPETADEIIYEVETVGEGLHTVYVVFFPIIDDSLIPLRFGGGFRGVNLCDYAEMPTMSCEDIEDCLETSPTIEEINNQITDINTTIIEIENNITIIDDDGQGNTGVNPPSYDLPATAGDNYSSAACNAAYFMADKILEFIAEWWEDASTIDAQELALKIIGLGGFRMEAFNEFLAYVFAVSTPTLPEDALDYRDNLAEAFFCNNLTRQEAANAISVDAGVPEPVKSALSYAINFITQDKLNQWAYVADLGTDVNDCSEMCSWTVVWDFTGAYEPISDETIYTGDTWSVYNGEYVPTVGYGGLLDTWGIQHSLPKDCRIAQMQVNHNKNVPCASVRERVIWRGTSGTDAEGFTSDATILSNTPTTGDWDLHSAEINDMDIQHDHFLCDEQYGSQIHWVKMSGTGAKPQA